MTLSAKFQQASNSTVIDQKLGVGEFVTRQSANPFCDADWRVVETLLKGFSKLCRKGWRVYFVHMEHSALISRRGDPAIEDGFGDSAGGSRPRIGLPSLLWPARTQTQEHSRRPTDTKMPRQPHDREAPEQELKATTATHKSLSPRNEADAGLRVAIAHRTPTTPHAHATSCPTSTCRQGGL